MLDTDTPCRFFAARLRWLPPALRAEVWRLAPGRELDADHLAALEGLLGKGKAAGAVALPGKVAVRWAGAALMLGRVP